MHWQENQHTNDVNGKTEKWHSMQTPSFSTAFKAKTPKGETVEGCFCSGVGKGVTIRFE